MGIYDVRLGRDPGEVGAASCLGSLGAVLGISAGLAIVIGVIVVLVMGVLLMCCVTALVLFAGMVPPNL